MKVVRECLRLRDHLLLKQFISRPLLLSSLKCTSGVPQSLLVLNLLLRRWSICNFVRRTAPNPKYMECTTTLKREKAANLTNVSVIELF